MKLFILSLLSFLVLSDTPENGSTVYSVELENPEGEFISLEDLRGKYVLLDFWASWCKPCRKENSNIVEAYDKYKKSKFINGKGFEVFSVSLDRDKKAWENAIKVDGLDWKNHGFDKGQKIARKFGVNSIPYSFLIDGNGKIIAQGTELRDFLLHVEIEKEFKK